MRKLALLLVTACSVQPLEVPPAGLFRSDPEVAGEHCAAGGVRISVGTDVNGDGILEDDEVTGSASYVCSGESVATGSGNLSTGSSGATGNAGTAGATGATGQPGKDANADGLITMPAGTEAARANWVFFKQNEDSIELDFIDSNASTITAGAFNGGGLGNKGFVSFDGYSGRRINKLQSVHVRFAEPVGQESNVYMNFLIDTNGDGIWQPIAASGGTGDCIVAANWTVSNSTETDETLNVTDAKFIGNGPSHAFNCGLPWTGNSPYLALSNVTGYASNAKLLDAFTRDGGMPFGKVMPSILFVASDSATRDARVLKLYELTLNWQGGASDVYDFAAP